MLGDRSHTEHFASDGDEHDVTLVDEDDHERLRRCLNSLTLQQRQAVTLAYHGHSYHHVAELRDLPLTTATARIRDGLIRLRDCYE